MNFGGEIINGIDLVDISLWLFTLGFLALVFYLQRESRREGYPVESDETGKLEAGGQLWLPEPKTFILPHGQGEVQYPNDNRGSRKLNLRRTAVWAGAPYEPTGNAMKDGVGPASYAERMDIPDAMHSGEPRIVPFRVEPEYEVARSDLDPRGLSVVGGDGSEGGTVTDLWIDRAEAIIRYLEVSVTGSSKKVLLPMNFAVINKSRNRVEVDAIYGHHFKDVPTTKKPDQVTRLEEDMITGYFGGGKLYADTRRLEAQA